MRLHARVGLLLSIVVALLQASATIAQLTALPQLKTAAVSAAATNAPAAAPPAAKDNPAAAPQPDATANKRAENAELLKVAQKKLDAGNPSDEDAAQEVALFTSVETVLSQQEVADGQTKDLAARKVELENQLQSIQAGTPGMVRSGTFIELDQLKDELSAEQARGNLVADKLTAAKAALERAQHELDASQVKQRQAQAAVDTNQEGAQAADLTADLEQAKQADNLALETTTLRQKQLARVQLDQQVQKLSADVLQEQVSRARPLATFSDADLNEQLAQIKRQEDALKSARDKAQISLISAQAKVTSVRKQYREATGDAEVLLGETLDAHKFARDKLDTEVNFSTGQLSRLADLRLAWNERFQIATHKLASEDEESWAKLKDWQASTRATLVDLATETRSQILQMVELRTKLVNVSRHADDAKGGPPAISQWLDKQRGSLEETLHLYENNMVALESCRRVHEKLLDEIGSNVEVFSPTQLAFGTWRQIKQFYWGTELGTFEVDGKPRPVYVGTVANALACFVAGLILSRILSALLANRLLKRFRLSGDATTAIRTLAFYTMAIVVAFFALQSVNVPLTAFTIFGGAIAIGVGFGSQALINNFIGGLIMLAERPVRIGERIVFGNHDGVVEEVGLRSTILRTAQDHLVTIPNSTLVHESIENVGRRRTICRKFAVGISYDTPREKIVEAVEAIRAILEEPGVREPIHPVVSMERLLPRVHFHEYNSDHLSIQIVYWFGPPNHWDYMAHSERVNLRILEEFERLGVNFASPSRTLYLAADPNQQFSMNLSSAGSESLGQPARRAG